MYEDGHGVEEDCTKAVELYKMAAEKGNAEAMNCLGVLADKAEQKEAAFAWYKKTAENGDSHGMVNLGCCYEDGRGTKQNKKKAYEWYNKAAEAGNAGAMNILGDNCLEVGNIGKAKEWYQKAVDTGDAVGMDNMGLLLTDEKGKDEEAVKLFQQAANKGSDNGMCHLALCYREGCGVEQDLIAARGWYQMAAELGNAEAMKAMGDFALDASIPAVAEAWYNAAFENGDTAAALHGLALLRCDAGYEKGAFDFATKSAEAGSPPGMYTLALFYRDGFGTKKNKKKAREWFKKAADGGLEEAVKKLQELDAD